jgi:hypothetical protein
MTSANMASCALWLQRRDYGLAYAGCSPRTTAGRTATFRRRDPALFDWLNQVVEVEKDRRTASMESSTLLGPAVFQPTILTVRQSEWSRYFSDCRTLFSVCDLVVFDPDNGLEIGTRPRGRRHSSKHLYGDEVCDISRRLLGADCQGVEFANRRSSSFFLQHSTRAFRSCLARTSHGFIPQATARYRARMEESYHSIEHESGMAELSVGWPPSVVRVATSSTVRT